MAKFCGQCGCSIEDGLAFCTECGAPIKRNPVERESEPRPIEHSTIPAAEVEYSATQEEQISAEPLAQQEEYIPTAEPAPSFFDHLVKGFKQFWYNQAHFSELSREEKKRTFIQTLIAVPAVIIIVTLILVSIIMSATSSGASTPTGVAVEDVVKRWNADAKSNPDGVTKGCKITKDEVLSGEAVSIGNGFSIKFDNRSSREIISVEYNVSDWNQIDSSQAISDLCKVVFSSFSSSNDEKISKFQESIKVFVPEGLAGFSIDYTNYGGITVRPIYTLTRNLRQSTSPSGLSFGITLEELCANYEEKLNADAMASLGYKSYVTDKEFIDCAKALLINSLKAPSTASFSEGKVEVKDSYGRAIVSITSESENRFGVPIRSNNLLAISAVCSNGEFYYGHYYFAPYSNDTEKEYNIGLLKTANDFDKPRHDSVPVTSNNFTFYQESDDFKVYNYNDFALSYFDNAGNLCAIVTIRPIDNLKSDESVRKDISFWLAAAMGSTAQISSDNMDKCFDFTIYQPSQRFYEDGILSESFVSDGYAYFGAIAVSPSKYGAGMNSFESIMAAQTSKTDSENISTEPVPSSDSVSERQLDPPATGEEVAVLHTSMGDIKFRLFPQYAPKAVENFRGLISSGYYNNLTFHRVSNNFVIQGGDPNGDGTGGQSIWGTPFGIEVSDKLFHIRGALSMANVGPNTNGSQFFIVQSPTAQDIPADIPDWASTAYKDLGGYPYLDGQYSVFGQVYEGMDIVDKIAAVPVDSKDKPITPVIITSAELVILK